MYRGIAALAAVVSVVAACSAQPEDHKAPQSVEKTGTVPLAAQQIKEAVVHGADASLEAGMLLERRMMQVLFASEDKTEGMTAFFDKRKPDFKGR